MTTTQSRAVASLVGLAVGDALGAPVEFQEPGEFKPVTDYRHSPVWDIPPGYWTDDTSMAICLAESIIARGIVDPDDLLHRFSRWYKQGENSSTGRCFDIGITTQDNIERFLHQGKYSPSPNLPHQSGNGGIMRLAPVAIRWYSKWGMAELMGERQSQTTHGNDECVLNARKLARILARAISGEPVHEELAMWSRGCSQDSLSNRGRCSTTLMAAMWCVGRSSSFPEAVLKAVNLGGDSDTIGAVTGQIAGSIWGMEGIPREWVSGLHQSARIQGLAIDLFWGEAA